MFHVCHAFLSVHCSLVVACWERAVLLAFLYLMFYCVSVTYPCGVLGQVWFLVVSIPDLCLLIYFEESRFFLYRSNFNLVQILHNKPIFQTVASLDHAKLVVSSQKPSRKTIKNLLIMRIYFYTDKQFE